MIKLFACAVLSTIMAVIVPTSEPYQVVVIYTLMMIFTLMTWDAIVNE